MRTLLRFAAYLRPHQGLIALFLVTMFAVIAGEMLMPRLLGLVIDRGISGRSTSAILLYTGLMFALGIARSGVRYGQSYARERMGQELIRSLRHDLYARLQGHSFTFFTVNATGDLMSRLTSDVSAVMEFFGFGVGEMISSTLMFIGTVVMLLWTDWRLALVVVIPLPILMFFAFRFSSIVGPAWEKIRNEMGKMTTTLQENVSGVRVVKSFAREKHEIGKFAANNSTTYQANIGRAALEARTFPVLNFITGFCFFLLYWYGSRRVYSGGMTLGAFFSFNWYLWGLIWPIRFLGYLISVAKEAIAAGPRLFAVLDSPLRITEAPAPTPLPAIEGYIRFEDVHFAFEDGDKTPVLKGLNLEIAPGQIIAVLGGTGSGKSSIINLIPRFYDPQQGRITIDGLDIRQARLDTLREQIGIVPQETFLFSDTVRNNIAFGRPQATVDEVEAAARAAQAHDFISKLPKGYDTRVGERGLGLSGGQKQRIAIARALLTDPRILILDEATSSVDAETEHALQLALDRLMKGRTSLVIAQRLSTVKNADKVIVIHDGVVVEEGTHEELLQKDGEYSRIYNLQLKPQEEPA